MIRAQDGSGERGGGVRGRDAGDDVDRHHGIPGVGLGGLEHCRGHAEDAGITTRDDCDLVARQSQVEGLSSAIDLDGVARRQAGQPLPLRHPGDVGGVADDVIDTGEHLARLRGQPRIRPWSQPDDMDRAERHGVAAAIATRSGGS